MDAEGQRILRENLRRLESTLARHEEHLREAWRLPDRAAAAAGTELLSGTARLLREEIKRLRGLLG
jgi:hypothetical protein